MGYLLVIGIAIYLSIIIFFKLHKRLYNTSKNKQNYHYFILVKNGQEMIEWVIRSIHFDNWIEGKGKKITVFDIGSEDDTFAILERLLVQENKIDKLYMKQHNFKILLEQLVQESKEKNEKPIILYVHPNHKSSKGRAINDFIIQLGEIS